jgi:kumamolisin
MAGIPDGYVSLAGSERSAARGARLAGPADPGEVLTVSVRVRRPPGAPELPDFTSSAERGRRRAHLSREEMAARYGALRADLDQVASFGQAHGLAVVESSGARRTVRLQGTVEQLSRAFAVELGYYESAADGGERYRGREGQVHVPGDLAGVVEGVFGLDNRRMARRPVTGKADTAGTAGAPGEPTGALTPAQVAKLYNFPQGGASGQAIGLLEFGGGYRPSDISSYFSQLNLPVPKVTTVPVDGKTNSPSQPPTADDEAVTLDIDVAGAVAQGADIAVYFAPQNEQGMIDAITSAIYDPVNEPTVLSIGWGQAELTWTTAAILTMTQSFQEAAGMGVTVLAASGDTGSEGGVPDGKAHAMYPASDPYVTGCGGTVGQLAGNGTFSESTWNIGGSAPGAGATGGGVSDVFGLPDFQVNAGVPQSANGDGRVGRGVPDVAGNAASAGGYVIYVDGSAVSQYGTNLVAPLYAGLVAIINTYLGTTVGCLNPVLYQPQDAPVFNNIHDGVSNAFNGAPGYTSVTGWNACTGWGSIDGTGLRFTVGQTRGAMWLTTRSAGGGWYTPMELFTPSPTQGRVTAVAAACDGNPGETQFLYLTADGELWHGICVWVNGIPGWKPPTSLKNPSAYPVTAVSATWNGNPGETQYMFTDSNGGLWYAALDSTSTDGWQPVAASSCFPQGFTGKAAVVAGAYGGNPGETQFVFTTTDGVLWHTVNTSGSWQQPQTVNGQFRSPPLPPVLAVSATGDGNPGETQFMFTTRTVTNGPPYRVTEWGLWHVMRKPTGKWHPTTGGPIKLMDHVDVRGPVHAVSATWDGVTGETQYVFSGDGGGMYHTLRPAHDDDGHIEWSQAGDVQQQIRQYLPVRGVAAAVVLSGGEYFTQYTYLT